MPLANGQTCLEYRGMEERHEELVRNDYQRDVNEYSSSHDDALSTGDPLGKGTGHGGHTHWLPDCTKPTNLFDYSNFDTFNGGGQYDIEGRNGVGGRDRSMAWRLYNRGTYEYGMSIINTELNRIEGQYYMV